MMAPTGNEDATSKTAASSAAEGMGKIAEAPAENKKTKSDSTEAADDCSVVSPEDNERSEDARDGEDLNDDPPKTFPQKLMEMLSDENNKDAITWLPHGKAFIIYRKKSFSEEVLPKYFKACKYTSFTRKLNRWGFTRVTRGPEMGSYFHPKFVRDDPKLCLQMCSNSGVNPVKFAPLIFSGGQGGTQQMIPMMAGSMPSMGMMGFFPGMMPFGLNPVPSGSGTLDSSTAIMMQQHQMAMFQQMQQFQMQQFQFQQQTQKKSGEAPAPSPSSNPAPAPSSPAVGARAVSEATSALANMSNTTSIAAAPTEATRRNPTSSIEAPPPSSARNEGHPIWQQSQHQVQPPTPHELQIQRTQVQPPATLVPAANHETIQQPRQRQQHQQVHNHHPAHHIQPGQSPPRTHHHQAHHPHNYHIVQGHEVPQQQQQHHHHHPIQRQLHHAQMPSQQAHVHAHHQHPYHQQQQPQQHPVHTTQGHGSYVTQQTSPQTLQTF